MRWYYFWIEWFRIILTFLEDIPKSKAAKNKDSEKKSCESLSALNYYQFISARLKYN